VLAESNCNHTEEAKTHSRIFESKHLFPVDPVAHKTDPQGHCLVNDGPKEARQERSCEEKQDKCDLTGIDSDKDPPLLPGREGFPVTRHLLTPGDQDNKNHDDKVEAVAPKHPLFRGESVTMVHAFEYLGGSNSADATDLLE
jgi:hypothetical protein